MSFFIDKTKYKGTWTDDGAQIDDAVHVNNSLGKILVATIQTQNLLAAAADMSEDEMQFTAHLKVNLRRVYDLLGEFVKEGVI